MQSTTWGVLEETYLSADKAINGIYDVYNFAMTRADRDQWWTAKFRGGPKSVREVRILSRCDPYDEGMAGATIEIDDKYFGTLPEIHED